MRLSVWSGPRNISTALMYSFRQRTDTTVVDEPLYAHYLHKTGLPHPGRDDVLRAQDAHGETVCQRVLHGPHPRPVVFFKNMAHHWLDLPSRYLHGLTHVFLVRDPRDMLASLCIQLPDCDLDATGLPAQTALFEALQRREISATVVRAEDIRSHPRATLAALCDHLGLAFEERMLAWPHGPKAEDGVWAPHWYDSVHRSTGFTPPGASRPLAERYEPLLRACLPLYESLLAHRISLP